VILLSKYDPLLNEHVKTTVFKSQLAKTLQKDTVHSRRPRGLATYLSKTNADYIIESIGILMKKSISESIREANFYAVQIDSTQDVNVRDQEAVIIRFVKWTLYRLFSTVKTCPRKTIITSLKSGFRVKIPIIKCIENNISKKMSYPFYKKVISKKDTAN